MKCWKIAASNIYKTFRNIYLVQGGIFCILKISENLLSQNTIEQILIKQNPKYAEEIKTKFSEERKYKNKKLGSYLDMLFKDIELKRYSASSGTIKNKLDFCQTALKLITDYDMLTEEAKVLTEKVFNFIRENNWILLEMARKLRSKTLTNTSKHVIMRLGILKTMCSAREFYKYNARKREV